MNSKVLSGSLLGGAYRVGPLLGEGTMGAVYEGTHEALNRKVAIKVLKAQGAISQDVIGRFAREARATAELGHPNIVQVTDFQWRDGEPPFLVMERLVGRSLREAIAQEKRLSEPRVAFVATQMLDALAVAHRAGIVHRDIKPDNVFLTRLPSVEDVVKILDFGVAKLVGEGTFTAHGARMGSPAYMSPEQASGRPVDPRTDLYCVGATLYHALAGHLPFDTTSLAELLEWIELRPVPALAREVPGIDPRFAAAIERAMAKDPAARFQTADEMKLAFEPLMRPRESISGLRRTEERVSHVPASALLAVSASGPLGRPMAVGIASLTSLPVSSAPSVPFGPMTASAAPPSVALPSAPYAPAISPLAASNTPPIAVGPRPQSAPAFSPQGAPPTFAPNAPHVQAPHAPHPHPAPYAPSVGAAPLVAQAPYSPTGYGPYVADPKLATEGASAWKIAGIIALWKLKILIVLVLVLAVVGAVVVFVVSGH